MEDRREDVDLTGLQPSYRTVFVRGARWLIVVAFALIGLSAVLRLFGDPDGFEIGLSVLQLACYGFMLVFYLIRPPAVFLEPNGLRFRRFVRTGPLLPWSDVGEVQVQGRWQDHSSILTREGRTLRLTGMPADDAQRLATALAAART